MRSSKFQVGKYLADPTCCPFCGAYDQMDVDPFEGYGHDKRHRDVKCSACKNTFVEQWSLTSIDQGKS